MSPNSSAPASKAAPPRKTPAEQVVRDICRATRKRPSAEDKIRLCWRACAGKRASPRGAAARALRRAWTTPGPRNAWVRRVCATGSSTAPNGKRRLAGDTARAATTDEVKALRQEASALKAVVAEPALELRLLKKA
jgi:transposase